MTKKIFSGTLRVARGTALALGVGVMLAFVMGLASVAFAANGDPWLLGRSNVATAITSLAGAVGVDGPMLRITNNNAGTNDTALDLRVQAGEAPMKVNSDAKVANLNADKIDGKEAGEFLGSDVVVRTADVSVPATDWGQGRATCQAGELALAGGGLMSGSVAGDAIMDSYPINSSDDAAATGDTPAGWDVWAYSAHNQSRTLTTYVVCAAL
jgi:hypothetical protein